MLTFPFAEHSDMRLLLSDQYHLIDISTLMRTGNTHTESEEVRERGERERGRERRKEGRGSFAPFSLPIHIAKVGSRNWLHFPSIPRTVDGFLQWLSYYPLWLYCRQAGARLSLWST